MWKRVYVSVRPACFFCSWISSPVFLSDMFVICEFGRVLVCADVSLRALLGGSTCTNAHICCIREVWNSLIDWARNRAGSAPQVIFYCSLCSIRAMLLPVLPDSCYITASLCVFLCHRLNDWTDVCRPLYFRLSYWLVWDLSGTIAVVVYHKVVQLSMGKVKPRW